MGNGNKPDFKDETADEYRRRITPRVLNKLWRAVGGVEDRYREVLQVHALISSSPRGRLIVVGMAATQHQYRRLHNSND